MQRIADGIYALGGLKTGRSYLLEDSDGLVLIDTSSGGAAAKIAREIASIGRRVEDVHTVIATHYHHDHTGNAGAIAETSGARLWVHEADVPYVDGRTPWMPAKGVIGKVTDRLIGKPYALRVDRALRDGETLDVCGGLDVVHLPGHTPGNIGLHATGARVLFAGDAFMNILGLRLPMGTATHDMDQARASVQRLAQLEFDIALPGHGTPVIGQASEKIRMWTRRWT